MAALTLQKKGTFNKREKNRLLFYIAMFAIPLLQFLVFYLIVNFNSIIMSFQRFDIDVNAHELTTTFVGFDNFKKAFKIFFSADNWSYIKVSLIFFGLNLFFVTPLALLFSFYIAKKYPLSGVFRVFLYLPHVLSAVVLVILYKTILSDVYVFFNPTQKSLLEQNEFRWILIYNLWLAYGTNTMLYTGAMSDINPSLIESSKLDGASPIQQFLHIFIPMIWPTLVTFIITELAGLFINQMQLYVFFQGRAGTFSTFGYYFYRLTVGVDVSTGATVGLSYPELSALGIVVTIIVIPFVLLVRKLLNKYGPSAK